MVLSGYTTLGASQQFLFFQNKKFQFIIQFMDNRWDEATLYVSIY
jgi:hypothetical protein